MMVSQKKKFEWVFLAGSDYCSGQILTRFLDTYYNSWLKSSDVRASSFWALGRLEPYFFWNFRLGAGSGSEKFASDGQLSEYLCTYRKLQEFLLSMCEPQVFGLQAVSGRAKFSLYGWADSGLGLIYGVQAWFTHLCVFFGTFLPPHQINPS